MKTDGGRNPSTDEQNSSAADRKIIGEEIEQREASDFEENDAVSEGNDPETMFESIRNHHASEALLTSLGYYFDKTFAAEYDEIQTEMGHIEIPRDVDRQMRAFLEKSEKNLKQSCRPEDRRRRFGMLAKACAIVLAVSLAVGILAAPQASALRMKIYRIFTEQHDGNMSVRFEEQDESEAEEQNSEKTSQTAGVAPGKAGSVIFPEDVDYVLCPAKIPEGYELSEVTHFGTGVTLFFYNEIYDDWLTFSYSDISDTALYVDTEHSWNTEIEINGQPAMLQESKRCFLVDQAYNDKLTSLVCSRSCFNKECVISIAESIQWYAVNKLKEKFRII